MSYWSENGGWEERKEDEANMRRDAKGVRVHWGPRPWRRLKHFLKLSPRQWRKYYKKVRVEQL